MSNVLKTCVPIALAAFAAVWGTLSAPLAQPQAYHLFADTRALLSIANAADTLSNLAFLIVGVLGLAFLWRERDAIGSGRFNSPQEMRPYWVFFAGVALTSAGSAWYHLAPDDARLVWDRLPIAIVATSLVAAVVAERTDVRAGNALLAPLVLLGVASVVYWRWSALAGAENLSPYVAMQAGSILLVLAVAVLYRSPYTLGGAIFGVVALYGVAKAAEVYDREVFELGGWISGHTLKHLAAAAGVYLLLRSLQRRTRR
ncbi:MAG: ceramidase [Betaproteobacteria bacterium]|nr:ceramidase [Betaproteobacteria bacterium]